MKRSRIWFLLCISWILGCIFCQSALASEIFSMSSFVYQVALCKMDDGTFHYIWTDGTIAFTPDYDYAYPFSEDNSPARVFCGTLNNFGYPENGLYGYVWRDGSEMATPQFEQAGPFSEGVAAVKIKGKWGYIDRKGKTIIEPAWDYAGSFVGNSAIVGKATNDKYDYYLIDEKGKVISDKYDFLNNTMNSFYTLAYKNGKYGYINMYGELVTPLQFDYADCSSDNGEVAYAEIGGKGVLIYPYSGEIRAYVDYKPLIPFSNWYAPIQDSSYNMKLMNANGKLVYTQWINAGPFVNGYSTVQGSTGYGVINNSGKVIIEPIWDAIGEFGDKSLFTYVVKDNVWYIINRENLTTTRITLRSTSNEPSGEIRGTKWGMSPADVVAIEGKPLTNTTDNNDVVLIYKTSAVNLSVDLTYCFNDKGLYRIAYLLTEEHTQPNAYVKDYEEFCNALQSKYGLPARDKKIWLSDASMYKGFDDGLAIASGALTIQKTYETDDSIIVATIMGDNYEINTTIIYQDKNYEPPKQDYTNDI